MAALYSSIGRDQFNLPTIYAKSIYNRLITSIRTHYDVMSMYCMLIFKCMLYYNPLIKRLMYIFCINGLWAQVFQVFHIYSVCMRATQKVTFYNLKKPKVNFTTGGSFNWSTHFENSQWSKEK